MTTVRVKYVGLKPSETDHLYGTGIRWTGLGDVQDVPAAAWEQMAKHTDVWELAETGSSKEPVYDADEERQAQEADRVIKDHNSALKAFVESIEDMSDDQVRAGMAPFGIKVHHKIHGVKLRETIRNATNLEAA